MGKSIQDMEYQRKLYTEKNQYLSSVLEAVFPLDFYREVFPSGSFERRGHYEDERGNGIGLAISGEGDARVVESYVVTDELSEIEALQKADFSLISPVSYFGRRRIGKNARYLYAMAFDLDGVEMVNLRDVIHQMNKDIIPKATYIVNSGTGLHLYYLLTEPVPMYPHNQTCLKELKYSLTRQVVWNWYTSYIREPQIQGILQGFRVIGSPSKLGRDYPVVAYRFGGAVSIDELVAYLPDSNGEQQRIQKLMQKGRLPLDKAKEMYPDWYERRIVRQEKRPRWTVKRDLYDWWLHRMADEIKVGHRYFGIMTLAIYAMKCGIDEEELRRDAFSLLEPYDEMSDDENNRFTAEDIICALEMYNENYVTFPRDDIEKITGVRMPVNRRNGRKQKEHLGRARAVQNFDDPEGHWRNKNGRPTVASKVLEWRRLNPSGRKVDCHRDTGLDPKTIRKWWNMTDI